MPTIKITLKIHTSNQIEIFFGFFEKWFLWDWIKKTGLHNGNGFFDVLLRKIGGNGRIQVQKQSLFKMQRI